MQSAKLGKRLGLIVQSIALNISAPLFGLFLSWMVIRLQSPGLWGEFVKVQVWVLLAVQVFAFGNKEYLLRHFSKYPAQLSQSWSRSFFSRALLLLLASIVFILLPISLAYKGWILTWCIVRFVYQSFDVLVLYRRQFYQSILAEVLGLLLLFVALYKPLSHSGLGHLLKIYVMADLLKAAFMLLVNHGLVQFTYFRRVNAGYFRGAWLFFVLGFTGLLATRTDQLCINHYLPAVDIAQYQVLTTFFIFLQALSNFVLTPFLKNLYRVKVHSLMAVRKRLFIFGLALLLPAYVVLRYVLEQYYHFRFPASYFLLGILYVLPVYFYAPLVHLQFRLHREGTIVRMNLVYIAASLVLNILLIPAWKIPGALLATGIAQLVMLAYLLLQARKADVRI